jgi:hypothetical protein
MTTAAVGILKAVRCGDKSKINRITKVRCVSIGEG